MRARKRISIEFAVHALVEKIHAAWANRQTCSLLCLNVFEIYDNVSHSRLLHNLRKRRVDDIIANWVSSFLQDRTTILRMFDHEIASFRIDIDIIQKFDISSILYLFYNVDLINIDNDAILNFMITSYVNDVIFLITRDIIDETIKVLKILATRAQDWVARHVSKFDVDKFHMIHFSSSNVKKISTTTIIISLARESHILNFESHCKYLDVIIDNKLHWSEHLNKLKTKIIKKLVCLSMLTKFTWNIEVKNLCRLYVIMILSQFLYCCSIWFVSTKSLKYKTREKKSLRILQRIQKRVVAIIFETFRIIFEAALDIEINLTSIKQKLNNALNSTLLRATFNSMYEYIFNSRASFAKRSNLFIYHTRRDQLSKEYDKLSSLQKLKYRYEIAYQSKLNELK